MLLALLIALIAWLFSLILPWWSLAIPCLVLGSLMGKKALTSFLFGLLGIGGLWLLQSLIIDINNQGILTSRIADIFSLPAGFWVVVLTAAIGGLAGGLSTLTGYLGRELFFGQRTQR